MSRKIQRIFTLSLTAIVIVIMAGLYFWQARQVTEEIAEEIPSTSVALIQREESEVAEISFYSEGVRTFLTPFTDGWGMIQWSYSGAPDYNLLTHLTRDKGRPSWIITAVDTAHENSEELELALFGLEPPAITVESTFHDGSRHTLHLGSQTANLQHYFLMVDDDPAIYLINAILGERLLYTASDMLDMSLPAIRVDEAEYIRIAERDSAPIVLALRGDEFPPSPLEGLMQEVGGEQLIMHEPIPGMALSNSRLMESVIHPISQLRLTELAHLHPENLTPYGLDNPLLEFIFRTARMEFHLQFGDTFMRDGEEFIYVKVTDRPHVFIARNDHAASLVGINPLNIADRFLALVNITDVESISIDYENSLRMVMNHIPDTFDIEPTINGITVDDADFRRAFRDIISLLADAEIEPFTPQGTPELTITHHRIDNPDTQLRFFNYNANFLAVSIDGGEAIFATNRRAVDRLIGTLEGLIQ